MDKNLLEKIFKYNIYWLSDEKSIRDYIVQKADSLGKEFDTFTVYHPVIKEMFGDDKNLPEHVVTAHDVDPYFRVKMQGSDNRQQWTSGWW